MKQKLLVLALLGIGFGVTGLARADLASGQAAFKAGRCDEAIKTLTPIAEAGDAAAQKTMGDIAQDDGQRCQGKSSNQKEAVDWYLPAARAGNVWAQRQLAGIFSYSDEIRNPEQGTFWLAKAAASGDADDLSRLATRYERGDGVAEDAVLAHALNLLASRRAKKNNASYMLEALKRNAADMAPEQVAEAEAIAAAWKAGTPLPTASTTSKIDPRDRHLAAAKAGDLEAARLAGMAYGRGGYGVWPKPDLSAYWLGKAAQGGIADAQRELSEMYAMGYGVRKDFVLAYFLHMLAVNGGDADSIKRKDKWDESLTEQQLAEGKSLLAKWKKGDALPQDSRFGMQRKVNVVDHAYGKLAPTPEVLALFKAASEGDEAEFARLLAKVDNINDYLVEDEKLLHALLLPAASLRAEANKWVKTGHSSRDFAHWQAQQARHAALLPAKTRMLALALQRGAVITEGTRRENAAALHLAAMFGTPEMVRLLLEHGADPRQYGGQAMREAPLEYALDQKEHGLGLPELITPEQRTGNVLALAQAGALRPYLRQDIEASREKESGAEHHAADYLLWPDLVAQTRGTEVLDALLKMDTSPAEDDEGKTVFGYAAEAGNAEAIAWLKQHVPRFGKNKRDRWLDAAMLAMYSSAPGRDKVLQELLVKDMNWSQHGPEQESFSRSHLTLYVTRERESSGTLLNHATLARRFEWIPKLAALGAPVDKGGSARDLADALRENDVEGVKALLAQGADPLESFHSCLSLALKAPDGKDTMLDLLLDHIVRVQKKTLAEADSSPLEEVLGSAKGISMPRLNKLLAAGASPQNLSGSAIGAAFSAPDRSLAAVLIEHGLLDKAGANDDPEGGTYFLFYAVGADRPDLLPTIIAHGEDPNRRYKGRDDGLQPNAVEYAISQGKVEALEVLLAHGGVIDTSTAQPWGTALDRAVASQDATMLRKVSKDFSLPLSAACLPSATQLAGVVLESPPDYWALLREHGFATGKACAGMQERLVRHLAESPDRLLEGWVGKQVVERLQQLAPRRESFGKETWTSVAAGRNPVLAGLLAQAGWKAPAMPRAVADKVEPQKNPAADRTLQAKLPGHYYLTGVREVGAEILLHPDGKFQYSMAYGAVDQFAEGSWKVWNKKVVFRSKSAKASEAALRPAADASPVTLPPGQLLVDLRYKGKSIPEFKVALLGDAPRKAEGVTGEEGWQTTFSGPVRQIAVSHWKIDGGKWLVYDVAAADAQRNSFQFDFQPPEAGQEPFDHTFDVVNGSLMLRGDGRVMEFEKH